MLRQQEGILQYIQSAQDLWDVHDTHPGLFEDQDVAVRLTKLLQQDLGTVQAASEAMFLDTNQMPETYRQRITTILDTYHRVFFQALVDPTFVKTFNKSIMIRCFYDHDCLPEWMQPKSRVRIRERHQTLHFVNASLHQVDATPFGGAFDLISTSNLFDWMEAQDGVRIIEELTDKLSLKGAMLIQMAFGSASDLAAQVPNACKFDKVSPNDLALVDYSHFWFRNPNGFAILRRR